MIAAREIGATIDAASADLGATLSAALEHLSRRPCPLPVPMQGTLGLDDGSGRLFRLRVGHGRLSRAADGEPPDTTLRADPLTLAGIVSGKRSGIDAFLRGRLRVRGNLCFALQLDGLFDRRGERSSRPKPRRVLAHGIDTFYLDAGAGPVVIALHGLAATNASMVPTIAALSSSYRVIAPDLPGFGDSAKPHAAYDPRFFTEWLVAFMDAIGVTRAHIVGNSMGGRIALETALAVPQRVGRLGLLAPSLAFRRFRHAVPIVKFLSPEMGALPVPVLRPHIERGVRLLFAHPERVHSSWYDAAVDEFLRVFRNPRGRVALFAAARQIYLEKPFGPRGFWQRLGRLETPALFLFGDRDRLVPHGFARHVEEALPSAESIVLPECGHVPQFELPAHTNDLLRGFFDRA